ncbi:hypothetical protein [Rhizobium sp. LjRoot254]|uniref:hypothetical protein n=1 Tax=Rhizobium sp. LjRoot254 TaxID=3342297 RepID=UPI003ECD288C
MNPHEMEARLNAHREVLITLLTALVHDERYADIFDELHRDTQFMDGEEDPGIVPSKAFASETHAADEIRRLLEAARTRSKAR